MLMDGLVYRQSKKRINVTSSSEIRTPCRIAMRLAVQGERGVPAAWGAINRRIAVAM
jgi:hypothetical protein